MKLFKISLAILLGLSTLTSCEDKLELTNPNQQTTGTFGYTAEDLEECVIAAYNHIRMEGTYARVGYTIDVCRGDEAWNSSQVWYMPFDDLNEPITDEIGQWSWRDWYYTINVCNFILTRCGEDNNALSDKMKHIKGQALFIRGLAYYNLAAYYQNPALITDYNSYSTLDGLYATNKTEAGVYQYDIVLDQVEADFHQAMSLLPSRDAGGEWAKGRATCGSAAGYYARVLMMRHKYSEALSVLRDIINKQYGTYQLMANYGDNFREARSMRTMPRASSRSSSSTMAHRAPMMSGHRSTPARMPHRALPSRATSVLATSADGPTSQPHPGSTTCSRLSAPQVANLTHASIGPLVPMRTTGRDSSMATCAIPHR